LIISNVCEQDGSKLPFCSDTTEWCIHPRYSATPLSAGQSTPAAPYTDPAAAKSQCGHQTAEIMHTIT